MFPLLPTSALYCADVLKITLDESKMFRQIYNAFTRRQPRPPPPPPPAAAPAGRLYIDYSPGDHSEEIGAGSFGMVISPAIPNIIDGKKVYYPTNVSKVFYDPKNYDATVRTSALVPRLMGHNEGHRVNTYRRTIQGKNLPLDARISRSLDDRAVFKAVRMPNLGVDLSKLGPHITMLRAVPVPYMIDQVVKLVTQLEGLYTHGYIHGDIREKNLMIHPVLGTLTLIDFDWLKPFGEFHTRYSPSYGFYSNPPETLLYAGLKAQKRWRDVPASGTMLSLLISRDAANKWASQSFGSFGAIWSVLGARTYTDVYRHLFDTSLANMKALQAYETLDDAFLKGVVPTIDSYGLGMTLANMLIQLYGPEAIGRLDGSIVDDAYISAYAVKLNRTLTNRGTRYTDAQIKACAEAICKTCAIAANMSSDNLEHRMTLDPSSALAAAQEVQAGLAAVFAPAPAVAAPAPVPVPVVAAAPKAAAAPESPLNEFVTPMSSPTAHVGGRRYKRRTSKNRRVIRPVKN